MADGQGSEDCNFDEWSGGLADFDFSLVEWDFDFSDVGWDFDLSGMDLSWALSFDVCPHCGAILSAKRGEDEQGG